MQVDKANCKLDKLSLDNHSSFPLDWHDNSTNYQPKSHFEYTLQTVLIVLYRFCLYEEKES